MKREKLTRAQADEVEAEMRALEGDAATTVEAMRLFMQSQMPCGHAVGNLLTCPTPPYGCVICGPAKVDKPRGVPGRVKGSRCERGICPACGKERALTKRGFVYPHTVKGKYHGGLRPVGPVATDGEPPEAVEPSDRKAFREAGTPRERPQEPR